VTARAQLPPEFLKLSTADLPERDRLAIWREVYGRFIFNVDVEPIGDAAFEAEIALRRLPGAVVTCGWSTPADYVLFKRLERAYAALTGPVQPGQHISSIAFQAGFNDLSYFNRAFRRRYGKSPSDVRKDGA
jgi:hypothetical protein